MTAAGKSILEEVVGQFRNKSADEIAEMMKRRHIKGRMGTTGKCPMALLLDGVSTGSYVIGRRYIARRSGKNIEKVRTPQQVSVFVRKFDIGGYPELIAPPPRCLANEGTPKKGHGQRGAARGPKRTKTTRAAIQNHTAKLVGRFHE